MVFMFGSSCACIVQALPWARKQAIRALMSEKLALKGAQETFWEALKNPRSKAPL